MLTATFVDIAKPTLAVTAPTLNQRWSNEVFTVKGKVRITPNATAPARMMTPNRMPPRLNSVFWKGG